MISNIITRPRPQKAAPPPARLIAPVQAAQSGAPTNSKTRKPSECARCFVDNLPERQKQKFRAMLRSGVSCGQSIANRYEVDHEIFMSEVKKLLEE